MNDEEYSQYIVEVLNNPEFDCLLLIDENFIHQTKHDDICV